MPTPDPTNATNARSGAASLPGSEPSAADADTAEGRLTAAWVQHVDADDQLLGGIMRRHRERHRRYHTLHHVDAVVAHVLELATGEAVVDLGALVAAAMYHDAIYEPRSPSNERASARLARRDLTTLDWSADRLDRIEAMIVGTASHLDPPDVDTSVLFDADLAILGSNHYDRYVTEVRAEYHHVADDAWANGRADVLRSFLERDPIYATATGRDRWESAAHANLSSELAALEV